MCRLLLYQGRPITVSSLLTEPRHSLINQSFNAKERDEPLNGDGFGLAWYNKQLSEEAALFKSITPAWNNRNLQEIARMVQSSCILAHVRAATQSLEVSETNCHPFKYRQFTFMHNGDAGGFKHYKRAIQHSLSDKAFGILRGSTDSEHIFALIIDYILTHGDGEKDMVEAVRYAVRKIVELQSTFAKGEHSYLNFVLSNGEFSVVVRFTTDQPDNADSLYFNSGKKYVCEDGLCYMLDPNEDEKAIIISSEPLSSDPGWAKVKVGNMITIHSGKTHKEEALFI